MKRKISLYIGIFTSIFFALLLLSFMQDRNSSEFGLSLLLAFGSRFVLLGAVVGIILGAAPGSKSTRLGIWLNLLAIVMYLAAIFVV